MVRRDHGKLSFVGLKELTHHVQQFPGNFWEL